MAADSFLLRGTTHLSLFQQIVPIVPVFSPFMLQFFIFLIVDTDLYMLYPLKSTAAIALAAIL